MAEDERTIRTASGILIPASEIESRFVRAQGPGGQKVNKTSTAVQLRFDLRRSRAFTETQRRRLLASKDSRLTSSGSIVIKAQGSRSREQNRLDAIDRLITFIDKGLEQKKPRIPTRPGKAAKKVAREDKRRRSRLKAMRRKPDD